MWKNRYCLVAVVLMTISVNARPQNVQIEKQVMIEIPFDQFRSGVKSKQTSLFSLANHRLHDKPNINEKSENALYYQNRFFDKSNQFRSSYRPFGGNSFSDIERRSEHKPTIEKKLSSEINNIIENLLPPLEDAPIISYSKPLKAVLEDQLKYILAEYKNLPKNNPQEYENAVDYSMILKRKEEEDSKKTMKKNLSEKFRGRTQKSRRLTAPMRNELLFRLSNGNIEDLSKHLSQLQLPEDSTNLDNTNNRDTSNQNENLSPDEMLSVINAENDIIPEDVSQRIVFKKGGIAIVGPKGIATAERGGTAIVGPNGVAYTKPNGVAIVGPGSRVVSLPNDADLNKLIYELYKRQSKHPEKLTAEGVEGQFVLNNDGSNIKEVFLPVGGRIVATGPAIYHDITAPNSVAEVR